MQCSAKCKMQYTAGTSGDRRAVLAAYICSTFCQTLCPVKTTMKVGLYLVLFNLHTTFEQCTNSACPMIMQSLNSYFSDPAHLCLHCQPCPCQGKCHPGFLLDENQMIHIWKDFDPHWQCDPTKYFSHNQMAPLNRQSMPTHMECRYYSSFCHCYHHQYQHLCSVNIMWY